MCQITEIREYFNKSGEVCGRATFYGKEMLTLVGNVPEAVAREHEAMKADPPPSPVDTAAP